nr:hypothetical protein [Tessaracoccus flavescens]
MLVQQALQLRERLLDLLVQRLVLALQERTKALPLDLGAVDVRLEVPQVGWAVAPESRAAALDAAQMNSAVSSPSRPTARRATTTSGQGRVASSRRRAGSC